MDPLRVAAWIAAILVTIPHVWFYAELALR
jgi:hypothetical protein